MSRRDIIIISVLLNASLLAVLFFMARHGEDETVIEHMDIIQQIVTLPDSPSSLQSSAHPQMIAVNTPQDEIDEVLKHYAIAPTSLAALEDNFDELDKEEFEEMYLPEVHQEKKVEKFLEITVKRGDALEKIARANGTSVDAIKKMNRLNNEKVFVGQVLKIPMVEKKETEITQSTPTKQKPIAEAKNLEEYYTVKSGDNPWKIAKLFHVKFDDLLKMNQLDEEKARNMKVGDKIRVR